MDFIKENYILFVYLITVALSIVRYKLYFDTPLKYLPILFSYTLLMEILGALIRDFENFQLIYQEEYEAYNSIIYNIFDVVWYGYFFRIFWLTVKSEKAKKIIVWGTVALVIASLVNPFIQNVMIRPQNFAIVIGSCLLVYCSVQYIIEVKKGSSKVLKSRNLLFWLGAGNIIFHSFYPWAMLLLEYDYNTYRTANLYSWHMAALSMMYACFILGYLKMASMNRFMKMDGR